MKTILFICKENKYRSQIAEALFNRLTTSHKAFSASGAEPADKISEDAVKLLKKAYNIDIIGQKPKRLTKSMLEKADRVIVLCNPEDCILIPKKYLVEHWNIQKMENLEETEKFKALDDLRNKVMALIAELG